MVVALWVLGVLLIAAIWTCIRFYDSIEQLERKLDASRSRSDGLAREVDHWIGQYSKAANRNAVARKALLNVEALRTDGMANIGQRMCKAASDGLNAMYPNAAPR